MEKLDNTLCCPTLLPRSPKKTENQVSYWNSAARTDQEKDRDNNRSSERSALEEKASADILGEPSIDVANTFVNGDMPAGPIIVEGNYETDSLNAEVGVGDVTLECNIVSIEKAEVDPLAIPNEGKRYWRRSCTSSRCKGYFTTIKIGVRC